MARTKFYLAICCIDDKVYLANEHESMHIQIVDRIASLYPEQQFFVKSTGWANREGTLTSVEYQDKYGFPVIPNGFPVIPK